MALYYVADSCINEMRGIPIDLGIFSAVEKRKEKKKKENPILFLFFIRLIFILLLIYFLSDKCLP